MASFPRSPLSSMDAFIEADSTLRLATWRKNYMSAIACTLSVTSFKPEDVAAKADGALIQELDRAHRDLGEYIDRIAALRPNGLKLVRPSADKPAETPEVHPDQTVIPAGGES